jgi:hypothetical protein
LIHIQQFVCSNYFYSTTFTTLFTDNYEAAIHHCAPAVDTSNLGTDADDENGTASFSTDRTKRAPQRYSDTEYQPESAGVTGTVKVFSPNVRPLLSAVVRGNIDPPPVPQHLSSFRFKSTCKAYL